MDILYGIGFLVLGVILGSFYACIGYRIPNKIGLLKPSSHCEYCNRPLKWYMNIPVFSYIFLKGKCAYCKNKIDVSTIFIELFTGITFMVSYFYFGLSIKLLIDLVLLSALSITSVSDFKYYYISDRVIFISLITIIATYVLSYSFEEYKEFLIAMVLLFVLMLVIKFVGDRVFKRECLGGGDVKLMLLVGASLGILNSFVALFIASVFALISTLILNEKYNRGIIPFGPFILLATTIVYILVSAGFFF